MILYHSPLGSRVIKQKRSTCSTDTTPAPSLTLPPSIIHAPIITLYKLLQISSNPRTERIRQAFPDWLCLFSRLLAHTKRSFQSNMCPYKITASSTCSTDTSPRPRRASLTLPLPPPRPEPSLTSLIYQRGVGGFPSPLTYQKIISIQYSFIQNHS